MKLSRPTPSPALRSLGRSVYLPSFLFAVGQGAVMPIVALAALDLGASVAVAGLVAGARSLGTMLFDVPAGVLVGRLGERRAIALTTCLLLVALGGSAASPSVVSLGLFTMLMGCGWSVWFIVRLSHVTGAVAPGVRGRALSTLGGVHRIGQFVGPFAGAGVIALVGIDGAYYIHMATGLGGAIVMLTSELGVSARVEAGDTNAEVAGAHGTEAEVEQLRVWTRLRAVARAHVATLATAGIAAASIGVVRSSRHVVVPLWGAHIGLDADAVGLVFGLSSAMDMLLFYPAGFVMDRWGRKVLAIGCLAVLSAGLLVLPLAGSFAGLAAVGVLLGFGNGLGSGILMTLGSDLSPVERRAEFLGIWRLIGDAGVVTGPALLALGTGVASLGVASVGIGVVGLGAATLVGFRVPETLEDRRRLVPEAIARRWRG